VAAPGANNVWIVGAGGQILHFDGCTWNEYDAGTTADLWWVSVTADAVFIVGDNGTIIRSVNTSAQRTFELMPAPTTVTLFGVYATSTNHAWAVGFDPMNPEPSGVLLHYEGTDWTTVQLPPELGANRDIFKVWGRSPNDVWLVGRDGLVLHYDGQSWLPVESSVTDWVTVTGTESETWLVGGKLNGEIGRVDGEKVNPVEIDGTSPLQGICASSTHGARASGLFGTILQRTTTGDWAIDDSAPLDLFSPADPPVAGCNTFIPDYHACAIDNEGGIYVVGGNFAGGLRDGALLYYGPPLPTDGL
jgi:hypothetical protein